MLSSQINYFLTLSDLFI